MIIIIIIIIIMITSKSRGEYFKLIWYKVGYPIIINKVHNIR